MAVPVGETAGWYMKELLQYPPQFKIGFMSNNPPVNDVMHEVKMGAKEWLKEHGFGRLTLWLAQTIWGSWRVHEPLAQRVRAFRRQIIHEASRIEDEAEHRARQILGVDRAARPERHDGDRSVDARLPAIGVLEARQRLLGHEHYDEAAGLHPELKAERARDQIVISCRAAADD